MDSDHVRIAIVYPGDYDARLQSTPDNNRFAPLFREFMSIGAAPEPAVYHPDFSEDVYQQLLRMDAVLVWVNPIQDGHDRTVLDAMLRRVSDAGVFVSTHPDVILKMGTKEMLYRTRHMSWAADTTMYATLALMRDELPKRLAAGQVRVLKQNRGHSGFGVWKIEAIDPAGELSEMQDGALVRVRHAERGSVDTVITLGEFFARCAPYFDGEGKMIDQEYQARLPEGMIRCYLVHGEVAGFGHQAINALYPTPVGGSPADVPQPGPRLYSPPDRADFQPLKCKLEQEWVPELQTSLGIKDDQLPVLWDADFLLGPRDSNGDTYVLCEVNVSSVAPYPDSATPVIARVTVEHARKARRNRLEALQP